MAQPKDPQPVKLIVGMLSKDAALFTCAEENMQTLWGAIDLRSDVMPFTHTDYYAGEMGTPLQRKFVSFAELIDPEKLAAIKHQTNALEEKIAQSSAGQTLQVTRPINLDPGYIDPGKLVLATTKNYAHRIYIGRQMYAETTLHYHKGSWQTWPFTYPDYASGDYNDFLNGTRLILMEQLSSQKRNT